ncbi:hypothetical protein LRS73_35565 (plasmid) [Methylobacterium currus]|uniref:hypothetical protein n=1 Tax=Methylobacterium currus TaxID=2051553 RepID=UPI001E3CA326|nr:hypothetical protein [Methylobacterium currus]UHC20452.1 hypothetical protein LRS73_35565 [Methylobacterium currus]
MTTFTSHALGHAPLVAGYLASAALLLVRGDLIQAGGAAAIALIYVAMCLAA